MIVLRLALKLPTNVVDNFLLSFPSLYKTKFINYESGVADVDLQNLLNGINETKQLSGNIIECGTYRCGTCSILASYLKSNSIMKKIYALDSFSGFNTAELKKERESCLTDVPLDSHDFSSYEYVQKKIKKLGLSDIIIPVKGFFQETLSKIDSDFCMGFIDCDLYESALYSAEKVWPRLVDNGVLFFHDYEYEHFKGIKMAVDKFVEEHSEHISKHMKMNGCYYVKKRQK